MTTPASHHDQTAPAGGVFLTKPGGAVTTPETKGILLPFYLVVDVSYSMMGSKLKQASLILPTVSDALAKNPILSDKVRFGVIDFSDDARVLLPLCDVGEQTSLPSLSVRGGTNFSSAFDLLRTVLEGDANQLKADGYRVHRPAVFFLSDGEPGDNWTSSFAALTTYDKNAGTGFKWYPVVIPFGVEDADRDTMRALVHPKSKSRLYMMADGADAADTIRQMAEILVSSIIASGQSAATGGSGLILPGKGQTPPNVVVEDEDDWLN